MVKSRLYYDIKQILDGILYFYYYSVDFEIDPTKLLTYAKCIDSEDIISMLHTIHPTEILENINKAEFSTLLTEIEEEMDWLNQLAFSDHEAAKNAKIRLVGSAKLKNKFIDWFEKNGFTILNQSRVQYF